MGSIFDAYYDHDLSSVDSSGVVKEASLSKSMSIRVDSVSGDQGMRSVISAPTVRDVVTHVRAVREELAIKDTRNFIVKRASDTSF